MQFYTNNRWRPLKTVLFFAVALWIAYLPVSSFLFFLKNDAFTGYFPPKFFMSESLHAGFLPLWNPYINFGIPQYGDMSSGYWSPVTWIIGSTVGYNAYSFTTELLLYILVAALGMYRLTGYYQLHPSLRFIAGLVYACSGYFTGHLQHFNWISGAALLPWCFHAYLLLLDGYSHRRILTAALVFSLLLASAHPGISIAFAYLLLAYLIFHLRAYPRSHRSPLSALLIRHGWLLALILLLCAGMITGYADVLPHFVRSERLSLQEALLHPTTASSWISLLLPFSTVKNETWFVTDISMRNCYMSVLLLIFLFTGLAGKKSRLQYFLLGAAVFFILLSAGGIFKTVAYRVLPLMGYVRLNGEFRIFALFCLILFSALSLQRCTQPGVLLPRSFSRVCYLLSALLLLAFAGGWYLNISSHSGIWYHLHTVLGAPGFTGKLKAAVDALSAGDTLWIQAVIQGFVLAGIQRSLPFRRWRLLRMVVTADLIAATLLNVPFTGAGQMPVSAIQHLINQSPGGIPAPSLQPLAQQVVNYPETRAIIGDWSLYSKTPGTARQVPYPIVLKNMQAFFDRDSTNRMAYLQKPFLFCTSPSAEVSIIAYSPQHITAGIKSDTACWLVLQQNVYPHWQYAADGKVEKVEIFDSSFMRVPVAAGTQRGAWLFNPAWVKRMMLLSLLAWIAGLMLLAVLSIRRSQKD
jgi:hypothetical protein